jgi:predicted alpha-1,2-mannosidase
MKKYAFLVFLFVVSSTSFGQNKSIENLKQNSDKARTVLSKKDLNNFNKLKSKTLLVNPFIGTGGHGHTYPGASAPFGMMQLSPDTRNDGWDGCGGYHYDDSIIYGFSHTHLSGTGVSDYADLLITPQVGKPKLYPKFEKEGGYGHSFAHESEKAAPGFYSVLLYEQQIRAEMTVDVHSGLHKYTFLGKDDNKYLLLDLDYRDKVLSADFKTIGNNSLEGHRVSKAWAEEQHFYFYLESNVDWTKAKRIFSQGRHKLLLKFPKNTKEIILRVGISAVDTEGAKKNLNSEIDGFDFNAQRAKVNRFWEKELSKIYFHSEEYETNVIFYTALYHSYLNPNTFSDVDGRYRGMDKNIHQLADKNDKHYTVFSLWDTFRATHPLFTITQQEKTNQFIRTFLRMDEQQNDLPVWELAGNETECMIGYHSVSVIADAFTKGIIEFDSEKALAAMISTSKDSAYSKAFYAKNGYLSLDIEPESVSKILEYAYDDFCISKMARKMGHESIAEEYIIRSMNFINHFDPTTQFFRARRGGLWMSPFRPDEVNFNFTEANAWQYSLFAPHAVDVLIDLHSGKKALENHLDKMFTANSETSGRNQADITGLIGQYAHGNEPSHHMAYLYNYVDRADKTQLYLDSILYNLYQNAPDGLSGNEDCGQMSSWFVLSALGLYQIAPGNPVYDIGRPLLSEGEITLENGKTFVIRAINQSKANKYVQKIELNGSTLFRRRISHEEIMNGGELIFTMGNTPAENATPILDGLPAYKGFTPIPHFVAENRIFDSVQIVDFNLPLPARGSFQIEYKVGDLNWETFIKPIYIHGTMSIEARTLNLMTNQYSATVKVDFVKKNDDLSIKLITPFTLPYASSGENALIDGIQGNEEFRTGDWQGFYGFDVKAEIQFKEPKTDFVVSVGMLEDLKSWIFYPEAITIEISKDGINFVEYKTKRLVLASTQYRQPGTHRTEMPIEVKETVKAIRVVVKNVGNCPTWHLGAGNPSWIFLDEIVIR